MVWHFVRHPVVMEHNNDDHNHDHDEYHEDDYVINSYKSFPAGSAYIIGPYFWAICSNTSYNFSSLSTKNFEDLST